MSNYPSSLPLCAVPWLWSAVLLSDFTALTSLKRFVFRGFIRAPARGSHLKRFGLEIVFSYGFGAHVFFWSRFLSTGSVLGHSWPKSLRFYSTFCVHFSKTILNPLRIKIRRSDWSFWHSRCGFVALPKSTTKHQRKYQMSSRSRTFCTRSRLKVVFPKMNLKKRMWLEHVCKVCSRLVLLLRFYSVFCVGPLFGHLGALVPILVFFFTFF